MIWIDLENRLPTDKNIPGWEAWSEEKWQAWLAESNRLMAEMEDLNSCGNRDERNKLIDNNSQHWGKLKPWLLALSGGKCWFSEAKEIYSHLDVEHFRPKKEAKTITGDVEDGYWWLAFDYMNFRACGNVGNRKKGGWFPLQEGSLHSSFDNRCEESETHYLLDPIDCDDVNLLAFDEEGNAVAAPGISDWEKLRVTETVIRLKLNEHEALTEERRKIWNKVSILIEKYHKAKAQCHNGGNPVAKEKAKNFARQVMEMTRADAELSSVAKWCVFFRNDPKLSKLMT